MTEFVGREVGRHRGEKKTYRVGLKQLRSQASSPVPLVDPSDSKEKRRRFFNNLVWFAVTVGALWAWWFYVLPPAWGGYTTMVIVDGRSMQPMLYSGDLAISRVRSEYNIGDLVIYKIQDGMIIHRIVEGSSEEGWITQGDNNDFIDFWTVYDDMIQGEYVTHVPHLGKVFYWVLANPLYFGAIAAGVVLLTFIPVRRKKISPILRQALAGGERQKDERQLGSGSIGVIVVTGLATLATAMVLVMGFVQDNWSVLVILSGIGFVLCSVLYFWLLSRLLDGGGMWEPKKTNVMLSGRLWLVDQLPKIDRPAWRVDSSTALRKQAEKYRLPVLHWIDPESKCNYYLVVTAKRGSYLWETPPPPRHVAPTAEEEARGKKNSKKKGAHRKHRLAGKPKRKH